MQTLNNKHTECGGTLLSVAVAATKAALSITHWG